MQSVISDVKRSRFSTIPNLTDEDVGCVWDSVSMYISKNMAIKKGVNIPKLGTFTFSQRKLDIGNSKFILIQRPIFIVSESFATTHALSTAKCFTDGQVPILPLNFAAISQDIDYDRDTVEQCTKEMLLVLSKSLQSKKNIEFTFPTIGRLIIRDSKVKMKFYKDFLQTIDATGTVTNAMRNRPETSDSVISRSDTPVRGFSSSIVFLPRINPGEDITETKDKSQLDNSALQTETLPMPVIMDLSETKANIMTELENGEKGLKFGQNDCYMGTNAQESKKASVMQGQKSPTKLRVSQEVRDLPPTQVDTKPLGREAALDGLNNVQRRSLQTPNALQPISPAVEPSEKFEKPESLLPSAVNSEVVLKTSNCFHDAGQELCYLCYQKERRNIPIYTHEERRRKELEEDRLLQQYQQIKDYEAILKDQDNKASNRKETQKVAAFNLGVAEAVKMKKQQKTKDFNRSFLFYKRSVSPPVSLSQQRYNDDLADQVKQRERSMMKVKKEKEIVERLEQVQLAEDLIAQREMYMKNKRLQSEEYKKSLDTQLRTKLLPISACYPDSEYPYFGKNEMNYDKMLEKRRENRKLFEDQLIAAAEKRRNAILTDLKAQKEETLMLKRAKTDLLEETIRKNRSRVNCRRDLEDTWLQAAKHKMSRELEEKERAQSPGVLLHDQCSKYKKCKSCERKLLNCGESNIWCESRYPSGSRIIT